MPIPGYLHVTSAGAGTKSGANWPNAMDWAALIAAPPALGYIVFFKGSQTYVLTANQNFSTVANGANPIYFVGVKTGTTNEGAAIGFSDFETDPANYPFFDLATYYIQTAAYYRWAFIYAQGSANIALRPGVSNVMWRCRFDGDNAASSTFYLLETNNNTALIQCDLSGSKQKGVFSDAGSAILNCRFKDFSDATNGTAITVASGSQTIVGNEFVNIGNTAVNCAGNSVCRVLNNSFYETNIGVSGSNGSSNVFINNIMEGNNSDGFKYTTQTDGNFFDGNHGDDARCTDMWDGVDETTVFKDFNVSTGNPLYVSAPDDLSLATGSPCRGSAQNLLVGVGSPVKSGNKGAWQGITNVPAASGGGKRRMSGTRCECKGGVCG